MTAVTLHPVPAWGVAFREQMVVVGAALRREGLLLVAFTALLMWGPVSRSLAIVREADFSVATRVFFPSETSMWLALAGLLVPVAVWRGADPARRAYHAAMPLPDAAHTLLKVACGWFWLLAGVALVQVAVLATAQMIEWILRDYPRVTVMITDLEDGPWRLAVPFTAATIGYLIGSALTLASRHPWRIIIALFVTLGVSDALFDELDRPSASSPARQFMVGRFGAMSAIDGMRQETRTMRGSELLAVRIGSAPASIRRSLDSGMVSFSVSVPSFERWLSAAGLWLLVGAVAVTLAARHRRE